MSFLLFTTHLAGFWKPFFYFPEGGAIDQVSLLTMFSTLLSTLLFVPLIFIYSIYIPIIWWGFQREEIINTYV